MKKALKYGLLSFLALVLLLVALHPWIIAGLVKMGGSFAGYSVDDVEAEGYTELRLTGVKGQAASVEFSVDELTVPLPLGYWPVYRQKQVSEPVVVAKGWYVKITPSGEKSPEAEQPSTPPEIFAQVQDSWALLERWLPNAQADGGELVVAGRTIKVETLRLADGELTLKARETALPVDLRVAGAPQQLHFDLTALPENYSASGELGFAIESEQVEGTFSGKLVQNPLQASWRWTETWLPEQADVSGEVGNVPDGLIPESPVTVDKGRFTASLQERQWQLQADIEGTAPKPTEAEGERTPVTLQVGADGDFSRATVQRLDLDSPFATASLKEPVSVRFANLTKLENELVFDAEVNFEALALDIPFTRASAALRLKPAGQEGSAIQFSGSRLELFREGGQWGAMDFAGRLEWPRLELSEFAFTGPENTEIQGQGGFDFTARTFHGLQLRSTVSPDLLTPFLPKAVGFEAAEISLDVDGPLFNPSHEGGIEVRGLDYAPLDADTADFRWQGKGLEHLQAALDLVQEEAETGHVELTLDTNLPLAPEEILEAKVDLQGNYRVRPDVPVSVALLADLKPRGITLEQLDLNGGGSELARGEGFFPFRIKLREQMPVLEIVENEEMDVRLTGIFDPALQRFIKDVSGLALEKPRATLDLKGSPTSPSGTISLAAGKLTYSSNALHEPLTVSDVSLNLDISEEQIQLSKGQLSFKGNQIALQAGLPMDADRWQALVEERKIPDLRELTARLQVDKVPMETVAVYLPNTLGRSGSFAAELRIEEDLQLRGSINISELSTRPLPNGAALQNVNTRLELSGRRFEIATFEGRLGAEPVQIEGYADFEELQNPEFNLHLKGKGLPLVRQANLIVRSDTDISITKEGDNPAHIHGSLNLGDSVLVSRVRIFNRQNVSSPESRPPYFRVEQLPFSRWTLDVALKGERFLRISSPLFSGAASIDMRLGGTLGEPRAIGEVEVARGSIPFPFGTIRLTSGEVRLTKQSPYEPQLFIEGEGNTLGYSINMSLTGTASNPRLVFTSSPPLTTDEILLLLTTGAVPSGDGLSSQARAQRFAVYAGKGFFSNTFGTGEKSFADRLSVNSGSDLSEKGNETYSVEFELSEDWSLIGEYDRFDDYNMGVKWNIYSE